ncbi:MAG: hypothetical protein BME93_00580 [Methanosarcinales archaeon Met12]|nr:MAG: hypothetical protein BME93_00580 [Methanosarcinales archaeon Met12]
MIDKFISIIKKIIGADKTGVVTDKDETVSELIRMIDGLAEEKIIDCRGFSRQRTMYKGALKTILEKQGESEARELCAWIMAHIKEHGKAPKSKSVREQAGLL